MRKTLSLFAFLAITANGLLAQSAKDMPSFKPEIKRIAVFKNGYAFTYREGEATTLNGWAYTTNVPIGVMGTVWGYSGTPNTKVQQLLASAADRPDTENIVRVGDLFDFLKVNEGLKVHVDAYDNKTFEGTYSLIGSAADNYSIALQTERGIVVIPPSRIQTVEIIGKPNFDKKVIVKNGPENRLAIRTDGAKDGQPINLGIAALERGIRWIPAYRVEVKGEPIKEAKLELEAVLVNELADLNNSEVYFVVGVPSFAFKDMLSPLSMNQAFAGVSGYFANTGQNFATNAIMTQQSQRMGETADESGFTPSPTTPEDEQTTSLSAEQLYLYKTDQLNLKKGERTSLRLFSLTIPASEVFEWTVTDPSRPAGDEYSPPRVGVVQDLSSGVWYSLRLKNETGMPLTTAPAITFREWKPLGQDMIKFTPTGGEDILRVSPATEVIGNNALEEKSREPVSLRMNGSTYSFDLITVEGTLKINNVKKQPVEMAITRNINGEVISVTDGGKIKREGLNLQSVNPNSVVKWNVTVPPGEKQIKYTYKIYIRK